MAGFVHSAIEPNTHTHAHTWRPTSMVCVCVEVGLELENRREGRTKNEKFLLTQAMMMSHTRPQYDPHSM